MDTFNEGLQLLLTIVDTFNEGLKILLTIFGGLILLWLILWALAMLFDEESPYG